MENLNSKKLTEIQEIARSLGIRQTVSYCKIVRGVKTRNTRRKNINVLKREIINKRNKADYHISSKLLNKLNKSDVIELSKKMGGKRLKTANKKRAVLIENFLTLQENDKIVEFSKINNVKDFYIKMENEHNQLNLKDTHEIYEKQFKKLIGDKWFTITYDGTRKNLQTNDDEFYKGGLTLHQNSFGTLVNRYISENDFEIEYDTQSDGIDDYYDNAFSDINISEYNRNINLDYDGSFFQFVNKSRFDLTKFQIYKEEDLTIKNKKLKIEHCLKHTLNYYGINTDKYQFLCNVKRRDFKKISNDLDICIILNHWNYKLKRMTSVKYNKTATKTVKIALYKSHYFPNDFIDLHITSAKKWNLDIPINKLKTLFKFTGKNRREYSKIYKSCPLAVIQKLDEYGGFQYSSVLSQYSKFKNVEIYELNDVKTKKLETKKEKYNEKTNIYFADFEAYTNELIHKPFCVCYKKMNGKNYTIYGSDCAKRFVNRIEKNSIVYFHNLRYDLSFLFEYLKIISMVKKENQIYSVKTINNIEYRDSYKIINLPLANFSKMFKLQVKKEIFPYDAYNSKNVYKSNMRISHALKYLKKSDYEEFLNNLKELKCKISEKIFDHRLYAQYYCNQDINTLHDGFLTFRQQLINATKIGMKKVINPKVKYLDIFNYLSISSFAHDYMIFRNCYENVIQIGSDTREFIQQTVYGGVTITHKNTKNIPLNGAICDFDAVSLYPSAISQMKGILKGKPKKIDISKFHENKNKWDHYFVKIHLDSFEKSLKMPIIAKRSKTSLDYVNEAGFDMFADKYYLEDMEKYHGIKYTVIEGVYFNNGYNETMPEIIKELFLLRLKYKKENNNTQLCIKLLMNSIYGKTIMKSTDHQYVYKQNKHFKKYLDKNFNGIIEWKEMGQNIEFKVKKSIREHYNLAHVGSIILSKSKQIMNKLKYEVCEKNHIPIFYQDTDSVHIYQKDISFISKKFYELYNKTLIGTRLGQFHSDFAFKNKTAEGEIYSIKTIILGKKCYFDRITDGKHFENHFRMKGISSQSILFYCEKNNITIEEMYMILYNGTPILYDLVTQFKPSFEFKNGHVRSRKEFLRTIQFK